ncbi:MAG: glycosyltransferase involved in cell wall biosynthesis [Planctomycetota bacterium]|jgi:glycosyltransferase involved in cell wall biosynthesis
MKRNRKLAIIGTVGLPANYGGFETLAAHLVENLDSEYDITVYCSGKKYAKEERKTHYKNAKLKFLPLNANGIQSIFYDAFSILHSLFYADVLLILGVAGAFMLPFVRLFTNKKIIISIDGIEWKRDKWNLLAKAYLFWAEGLAVKYSHIDISDNESIQDYTALRYKSLSRVIEYGADHTLNVKPTEKHQEEFTFLKKAYAFKVCRIEPENNVHTVLEAFAALQKYTLVIVGNWNNSKYGQNLRITYKNYDNIILLDPIYNQEKLDTIRGNAFLYVHGHSAGGTNPSLVEAMYLGLPIFSFKVSYNLTTTENKAKYFTDTETLKELITSTSFAALKEMGDSLEAIAKRRYVWSLIADKYRKLIQETYTAKSKTPVLAKISQLNQQSLSELNLQHLVHTEKFYKNI